LEFLFFNRFELLKSTLTLNIEALIPFADSVEVLVSGNGSEQNVREYLKLVTEEYLNFVRIIGFDKNQVYSNNYFNILKIVTRNIFGLQVLMTT